MQLREPSDGTVWWYGVRPTMHFPQLCARKMNKLTWFTYIFHGISPAPAQHPAKLFLVERIADLWMDAWYAISTTKYANASFVAFVWVCIREGISCAFHSHSPFPFTGFLRRICFAKVMLQMCAPLPFTTSWIVEWDEKQRKIWIHYLHGAWCVELVSAFACIFLIVTPQWMAKNAPQCSRSETLWWTVSQ